MTQCAYLVSHWLERGSSFNWSITFLHASACVRLAPTGLPQLLPVVSQLLKKRNKIVDSRKQLGIGPGTFARALKPGARLSLSHNRSLPRFAIRVPRCPLCFLSLLVVAPPCHSWLSPLVVALTKKRETGKLLCGHSPARLSRFRAIT